MEEQNAMEGLIWNDIQECDCKGRAKVLWKLR
jgi:hypothetical protein